jgi:hypothetical protein
MLDLTSDLQQQAFLCFLEDRAQGGVYVGVAVYLPFHPCMFEPLINWLGLGSFTCKDHLGSYSELQACLN